MILVPTRGSQTQRLGVWLAPFFSKIQNSTESLGWNPRSSKKPTPKIKRGTLALILLNPKSRGEIRLRSSDMWDKPMIIPNYFDHSDDLKAMKFQVELVKKPSVQKYNATLVPEPIWGSQKYTFMLHDYW